MHRHTRIICLAACAAALCILMALALSAPLLIDHHAVKGRLIAALACRLRADVTIERLSLSVVGRPHLVVQDVVLSFHDGRSFGIKNARVYPSLRALLAGKLEPVLISLQAPAAHVQLPRQQAAAQPGFAPEAAQKKAAEFIEAALKSLPACPIAISDGTVGIAAPDGTELVVDSLDAEIAASAGRLKLSVSCASRLWEKLSLTAQYCSPAAPGDEAGGDKSPAVSLGLEATAVDIPQSRDMLLAFTGNSPLVSSICARIHGGEVRTVSLAAQLPHISDPLPEAVISGHGSFDNLSLSLAEIGLDVQELGGDCALNNGMIEASNIRARLGKSRIHGAALHLAGAPGFKPALLTAAFTVDLSEIPGLLHLIPAPAVRSELEQIRNPQGTARGRLAVRADGEAYSTEVVIDELLLRSDYRAFPPELELSRGTCTYRAGQLLFSDFSGKLGSSMLPDFSLSFSLRENEDHFTATARQATVALRDLRTVLASFEPSRALIDRITGADGRVQLQALALSGPLTTPQKWTVALQGAIEDVALAVPGLEGPVAVRSGLLKADQQACSLSQVNMRFLDATLAGSLALEGYLAGVRTATAVVRGTLGEKSLALAAGFSGMPAALALRAPVESAQTRLVWKRGGATTCAGDFSLGRGIKTGLSIRADKTTLAIDRLTINDTESQCTLSIKIEEDLLHVAYAGMLKKATLDRALLHNPFLQGWIQGDFGATFNEKKPQASSAQGTLAWERAGYPAFDKYPANITSASVSARDNMLLVESAGVTAGRDAAGIKGSVGFTDSGFVLDLDISADRIDLDALENLFSYDQAPAVSSAGEFWDIPLRGTVRLQARELKKDFALFAPFHAAFAFSDKAITMTASDTQLCHIELPGTLRITPGAMTLEAYPRAEKSPLKMVLQCLTGEKAIMTGTVDIEGAVQAQGKPADLPGALAGDFSITAQGGRIYKSGLFTKILSFLSIRNLLSSGISDMARKGYAYQSLRIQGGIKGETVQVREAVLISSSLTLVCQGSVSLKSKELQLEALATPFQVTDLVLSKIPLVGAAFNKPVIGVPLKITGTLEAPQVSSRAASAVGKSLVEITNSILKLPVKIIEPAWPQKPSEK